MPSGVRPSVPQPNLRADANGSLNIDAADYIHWRNNFGALRRRARIGGLPCRNPASVRY